MAGAWRAAHLQLGLSRCCPRQLTGVESVGRVPTLLPVANRGPTQWATQRRCLHYRVGSVITSTTTSIRSPKRHFSNSARRRADEEDGASTKPSPLDYLDRENEELDNRARVVNRLPLDVAIGQQVEESLQKQLELARVAIKEGSTVEDLAALAPELNKEELVSYQSFIRAEYRDEAALREAVKNARQATNKSLASTEGQVWLKQQEEMIREVRTFGHQLNSSRKVFDQFWQDDEADPDYMVVDDDDDEPRADDITSMGHAKLDEVREHRQYARVAAWEMPLLSKFAKPFQPPAADEPLRFRYTSYMGEFHPAEKKVVVEFVPEDLDLTEAQQLKLKKLVGVRYNPQKGIVRMSCEQFEHQAQNKRYLGDLVESLIAEAKDPTDMFEDIPLDTRHHTWKTKPKFPREWRMSEERQKELHDIRAKAFLLDSGKQQNGTLVDGVGSIAASLAPPPRKERIPELVRVPAGGREASPRQ